ncbi:carbon-nitrogen hydrolase family protein [Pseudooceanicola nanhaiensis]|uniref:carbon-nitrogen hydrolase family protein n=1 Tax=Pseudooceanicola nanhaiensis TaxID=375761 RepID=UPI001CD1976E|nr:carbon-nitrogen hydrolase family protein [Pseudooceanicola nanhaiensis]MCA0921450.1 carbon-nitrogen hydrolase family protein [Pseudooceanicola nanhaiensis]
MRLQHPAYKVAAVQASPAVFDISATVDKCCALIEEAAANGAKLIAFPESFLPGFPVWVFESGPFGRAAALFTQLFDNAVEIPGEAVRRIAQAARRNAIYVCLGITERDQATLYLTQLWFDDGGNIIGKHRKLKPTGPERYIWGEGDGSTLSVFKTPLGNLGGLLCWEHRVPLAAAVMAAQNEQVHVASWPPVAAFTQGGLSRPQDAGHTSVESPRAQPDEASVFEVINRSYAMATQSYVVAATHVLTQEYIDHVAGGDEAMRARFRPGCGTSRIINPDGATIGTILPPETEGLIYADIGLDRVVSSKYLCDTGGHYAAPQVMSIRLNRRRAALCDDGPGAQAQDVIRYDDLAPDETL